MIERSVATTAKHERLFNEMCELLKRHTAELPADEVLGITAQVVGMTIALQDQRTMTHDRAMKIVGKNIEIGNARVVNQLLNAIPAGRG